MKQWPRRIVSGRGWILGIALCLAVLSFICFLKVQVNYDMTKYLPDDSAMKQGMDIMNDAFPSLGADKSIRVMARGLNEAQQAELKEKLRLLPYVEQIAHDDSEKYHRGDASLFVISTSYDYGSPQERSIEKALEKDFAAYNILYRNDNPGADGVPAWLLVAAVVIIVAILLLMCRSWFEPFLYLIGIGVAVVLNEGSNLLLGQVSYVSSSIAAMLQMVLSIDYSIMLVNRYRQEKAGGLEKNQAMEKALKNCLAPMAGSAFTTAAGLMAMAFMRFKVGLDLGVVLAKGVLLSLLCAVTLLPGLVVLCDNLLEKSEKKALRISLAGLARFSYRGRLWLSALFLVLFGTFFFLQKNTQIAFTLTKVDPIADTFPPDNMLVMLYENQDEAAVARLTEELARQEGIDQIISYHGLFEKAYGPEELTQLMKQFGSMGFDLGENADFDPSQLEMLYALRFAGSSVSKEDQKMSIPELFSYVNDTLLANPLFGNMVSAEMKEMMGSAREQLAEGMKMLQSDKYSRAIFYTSLPVESEKTEAFMNRLTQAGESLSGSCYLIGNSAMSYEMLGSFSDELWNITLLTAAAIFLIVLITSRSLIIPVLLVLVVQCGVYMTVTLVGWQGYSIYFLALLMVECILMGATIDYGILFTSYYRESVADAASALRHAYESSIHSIMTSGLIIVLVTGIFGHTYPDPTIAEICRTISTGALSAILLILLLLPALLALSDRWIRKRGKGEITD